jgi:hypothetical protein
MRDSDESSKFCSGGCGTCSQLPGLQKISQLLPSEFLQQDEHTEKQKSLILIYAHYSIQGN